MVQHLARAALTVACWLAAVGTASAQKTDVVELRNGDRITCEIQKLARGKLTVKTDGIGTISIEWDDVERVRSTAGARAGSWAAAPVHARTSTSTSAKNRAKAGEPMEQSL